MDAAITKMIAQRVRQRGQSLAEISRSTGIPPAHLAKLAKLAGIRYRNQRASPERIKGAMLAVTVEGLTFRAAARRYGMSKTAVHRFIQKRRQRSIDAAGAFKVERRTWRCPVHGKITVFPCVACAARENRGPTVRG